MRELNTSKTKMSRISRKVMAVALFCLPLVSFSQIPQVGTLVGSGGFSDATGTAAQFNRPGSFASKGNTLYVADESNGRIRSVNIQTGAVTTVRSGLTGLKAIAVSPTGDTLYYISQVGGATAFNILSVSSGNVLKTYTTESGLSAETSDMLVDNSGIVYIADSGNDRIKFFSAKRGFPVLALGVSNPRGLALKDSVLYVGREGANSSIGVISAIGVGASVIKNPVPSSVSTVTTVASTGLPNPYQIAFKGNDLIVAGGASNKVVQVNVSNGTVTDVAGSGTAGFSDASNATAQFNDVRGLAVAGNDIIVGDYNNNRLRLVSGSDVTTLAGSGSLVDAIGNSARLSNPHGVAISGSTLYFTDRGNNALRKVTLGDTAVTTVSTQLNAPNGLAVSATGDSIFVANEGNNTIALVIVSTGATSTFAASFNRPTDVERIGDALYVADNGSRKIKRVSIATQQVSDYAGNGVNSSIDASFRTDASFSDPVALAYDGTDLFVTDNNTIRRISNVNDYVADETNRNPVGRLTGTYNQPYGLAFASEGTLYLATEGDRAIRRVNISTGAATTIISSANAGFVNGIQGVARFSDNLRHIVSANGVVYIADAANDRIRLIELVPNTAPSFSVAQAVVTVNEDVPAQTVANVLSNISAGSKPTDAGQTVSFIVGNSAPGLFAQAPAISSNGTLTFRPAANAFGTATVSVQAQDNGGTAGGGIDTSAVSTFTIVVNNLPDVPTVGAIANQTINSGICRPVTFTVTNLDGPADSLKITAVSSDTILVPAKNITIGGSGGTRSIQICPVFPNFGSSLISVRVANNDTAFTRTFTVTTLRPNTPPSFVGGPDITVREDAGAQTIPNWATKISKGIQPLDSAQQLTFTIVSNSNPSLFLTGNNALRIIGTTGNTGTITAQTGSLLFTPAPNQFGAATIIVRLQDNGGTANGGVNVSTTDTLQIMVLPVNDAPAISQFRSPGSTAVRTSPYPETVGANVLRNPYTFSINDVDNAIDSLKVTVKRSGTLEINPDSLILTGTGANRQLSLRTPAGRYGRDTVSITATDTEGASSVFRLIVNVNSFNTPPTFNLNPALDTIVLKEDSPAQNLADFVTNIQRGIATSESNQTVIFTLTNSNPSVFSIQPAIATIPTNSPTITTRPLTFTPAKDASGISTITVTAKDNTNNTQAAISAPRTFVVKIVPVNDAPSLSAITNRSLALPRKGEPTVAPITVTFTARDADTPPASLKLTTSYDTSRLVVLPTLSGTSGNMVISVRPINFTCNKDTSMTVPVAIILADDSGASARSQFNIVLTTRNPAPNGCTQPPVVSVVEDNGLFYLQSSVEGTSYEWLVNGSKVDTLTTRRVLTTSVGPANVIVRVRLSSGEVLQSPVFVYSSVSDKVSSSSFDVKLYPNPASAYVTVGINKSDAKAALINVYSVQGVLVYSKSVSGESISESVDVSGLAAGYYIVKVVSGSNVQTIKFVKQ